MERLLKEEKFGWISVLPERTLAWVLGVEVEARKKRAPEEVEDQEVKAALSLEAENQGAGPDQEKAEKIKTRKSPKVQ